MPLIWYVRMKYDLIVATFSVLPSQSTHFSLIIIWTFMLQFCQQQWLWFWGLYNVRIWFGHCIFQCACYSRTVTLVSCHWLFVCYSFVSSSGCGFEAFITSEFDLVIATFNKKEHSSAVVTETELGNGLWVIIQAFINFASCHFCVPA